jgi:hypothetical protein
LKGLLHAQCQPAKSRKRHNPGQDQRWVDQQGSGHRQKGRTGQDSHHGEDRTNRIHGAGAKTARKTPIARHRHPIRNGEDRRGQTNIRQGTAQQWRRQEGQPIEALRKNAND